ncbi:orphan G-protein coupled receptor 30 [Plakobranchus ocellatus]|uniref:Orphan G-protein coupled receptor 30 n=1 Tax=Plakobranchus ocellatus TaxID=259542 RepID=A0AAV4DJD7_9GAST|nr:orphan G-protein coupled receptor 30 [Plakobranchus ocellatus]
MKPPRDLQGPLYRGFQPRHRSPGLKEGLKARDHPDLDSGKKSTFVELYPIFSQNCIFDRFSTVTFSLNFLPFGINWEGQFVECGKMLHLSLLH